MPPEMGGMPPEMAGMPPPPSPVETELKMQVEDMYSELDKLKKDNKELKDENRALHLAVGDDNRLPDAAKRLYDNAGQELNHVQKIPDENSTDVEIPKEDIKSLMDSLNEQL
jgi:regulator of replication initiation timing